MIRFVGDTHGDYNFLDNLCYNNPKDMIIGVGDHGLLKGSEYIPPPNFMSVLGNHDDRGYVPCVKVLGVLQDDIFGIGGAHSLPGTGHSAEEILSHGEIKTCSLLYKRLRPKVVVSHDCPMFIRNSLSQLSSYLFPQFNEIAKSCPSSHNRFLSGLFEIHQPDLWIFGHWHISYEVVIGRTRFKCLGVNEVMNYAD